MAETMLYMVCPRCWHEDVQLATDYESGLRLLCEECDAQMEIGGQVIDE